MTYPYATQGIYNIDPDVIQEQIRSEIEAEEAESVVREIIEQTLYKEQL
ncbi:MAG TPA: hypothetical protein VD794_02165 [Flavisolibacter sp.]|nr:hypothetical protein [Flavisolibacter sp.]